MSSTAAASPNRFVTCVKRRCAVSATAESCHSEAPAEALDDDEHDDRHPYAAYGERGRPSLVAALPPLDDVDGFRRRSGRGYYTDKHGVTIDALARRQGHNLYLAFQD